jgi:hypothetical protein
MLLLSWTLMRTQQMSGTALSLKTEVNDHAKSAEIDRYDQSRRVQFAVHSLDPPRLVEKGGVHFQANFSPSAPRLHNFRSFKSPDAVPPATDHRRFSSSILKEPPTSTEVNQRSAPAASGESFTSPSVSASSVVMEPTGPPESKRAVVSFWTLWRNGPSQGTLTTNGQIGGSQSGVRARIPLSTLGSRTSLNISSRLSSPLTTAGGMEASIGASIAINTKIPVELIVERRIPIGGAGKQSWSLTGVSGFNAVQLPQKLQADGYLQTGIVGSRTRRPFIGGNIVVSKATDMNHPDRLRLGLGLWGDAQAGLSRVDIGPEISFRAKSVGLPVRISAQWRFRVAGDANPPSGPAVVIGGDF